MGNYLGVEIYKQYDMFTRLGDNACEKLTKRLVRKIMGKRRVTFLEIQEMAKTGIAKIRIEHPEVDDTEPPINITDCVRRAARHAGYAWAEEVSAYRLFRQ